MPSTTSNHYSTNPEKSVTSFFLSNNMSDVSHYEPIIDSNEKNKPNNKIQNIISTISSSLMLNKANQTDAFQYIRCYSCNKKFNELDFINNSFRNTNDNEENYYICDLCDKSWFSTNDILSMNNQNIEVNITSDNKKDIIKSKILNF